MTKAKAPRVTPDDDRRRKGAFHTPRLWVERAHRELERELRRKDKALAEAAALLVLQKKVQALWGDADDDTKRESDE
jgi:hypothetical protein